MTETLDLEKCALVASTCVAGNLRQASRAVSQLYDEALRPCGLRATQFKLLIALAIVGAVPITQLAEALVMDRTTLSRNLKPLEREGWVQTEPDIDRRRRLITLTPQGEAVLACALPLWEEAQSRIVQGLGRERFTALLSELATTQRLARSK